jgi:hypothetical protein
VRPDLCIAIASLGFKIIVQFAIMHNVVMVVRQKVILVVSPILKAKCVIRVLRANLLRRSIAILPEAQCQALLAAHE